MHMNPMENMISNPETKLKNQTGSFYDNNIGNVHMESTDEDCQTALNIAVSEGNLEMIKISLDRGASVNKPDARAWTPIAQAEKQSNKNIYDLLMSYKNGRASDEHRIEFLGPETEEETGEGLAKPTINEDPNCSHYCHRKPTDVSSSNSNCLTNKQATVFTTKRVTIHMKVQKHNTSQQPLGKLIILPDSLEALFQIAGKLLHALKSSLT